MKFFDPENILSKKEVQLGHIHSLIEKSAESGLFYRFAPKKRNYLVHKFRKLKRQVNELQFKLKIAALAGSILATGAVTEAQAQSNIGPFQIQSRAFNPLRQPLWGDRLKPTIVDLDKDGDYDVVVGQIYGNFRVFLNEGDAENPKFTDYNLLDESMTPIYSSGAPAFADLNGDGLDDLIIGFDGSGDRILYFVNNGGVPGSSSNPLTFTEQFGPWDPILKTGNPFDTILPGDNPVLHFVNFDADSDMDVLIGHNYSNVGDGINIHYYENDGSGVFTLGTFATTPDIVGSYNYDATPFLADLDEDGDDDFIMGRVGGDFMFFKKTALGFEENADPWDPMTKTGNPLYGIDLGYHSAAVFADFDNDGDLDMVAGSLGPNAPYDPLHFFLNQGNGVFVEQIGLDNPFDGVDIGNEAAPNFVDLDGDNDLDVIIGRDDSSDNLSVFINNNGLFLEDPAHPIAQIDLTVNNIKPLAIDMDSDGDIDLFVALDDQVIFYRNNNGSFDIEPNTIDVTILTPGTEFSLSLIDINMDGNLDAILGSDGFTPAPSIIQYMENQGTNAVPNFVAATSPSPFDALTLVHTPNVFSADIDHDGDTDLLIAESIYDAVLLPYVTTFRLFINNGNQTFSETSFPISLPQTAPNQSYISLADIDGDGDLDIFIGLGDDLYGDEGGTIKYLENQNPPPIGIVNSSTKDYTFGDNAILLDGNLTITDTDNDLITRTIVAIANFAPGQEVLTFTPSGSVSGQFDNATGILTLTGTAAIATYQSVLRTVAYNYIGTKPGTGGRKAGRTTTSSKNILIRVFDEDFTTPGPATISLNLIFPNNTSVLTSTAPTLIFTGGPLVIDGTIAVADADDNDLESATIQVTPLSFSAGDQLLFSNQNGIIGTFDPLAGVLTLSGISSLTNYQTALRSVQFSSSSSNTTTRVITFSVNDGEDSSNVLSRSISVNLTSNQPPVFSPLSLTVAINGIVTLDLNNIVTDPDDNLDPSTFNIVKQPISGATASISNTILTVDYSQIGYTGLDNLILEVFDMNGERAEATITIQVGGAIIVRNGISPNGDGYNSYFKIENIESVSPENTVSIFNRWGDKVFGVENYVNTDPAKRFNGQSDKDKDLPSGIYFYKIEFEDGRPELTGYLTLKR